MYSSYTAACFARKHELAARHGVNLEGALTWAFEFEGQPFFAGFRSLASNGLDKSVLNVFRMFSQMTGQQLAVASDHAIPLEDILQNGVREEPDISAMASLDKNKLCVMVWHYHDDDMPGPSASVELILNGLTLEGDAKVEQYRIDEDHSNAFSAWKRAGSPQQPTIEQYAQLEKAGQLTAMGHARSIRVEKGISTLLRLDLPRQGVSLLKLTW